MNLLHLFTEDQITPVSNPMNLGGKGNSLAQMKRDGFNVPSGLIIPTEVFLEYRDLENHAQNELLDDVTSEVMFNLKKYVWPDSPHKIVSVRSGAPVSLPGMMDTILNVGIGYTPLTGKKLTTDCKRRFVEMYADVVMGHEDKITDPVKWMASIKMYIPKHEDIIRNCIEAVWKSWDNPRAVHYRQMNGIPDDMGTAVIIQNMVFGNYNNKSASGVLFTRNPSDGHKEIMGEYLVNAQGEDVVAGTHTPEPFEKMTEWNSGCFHALCTVAQDLEAKAKDMQDIEFTIQDEVVYILQTRNGKRTPRAEIQIALDLLDEGVIDDLGERVSKGTFSKLRQPTLPKDFDQHPAAIGIPAGGYFATGKAAFSEKEVLESIEPTIFVAEQTTPDDIKAMERAVGVLTFTGGTTCHAAVVMRGMNKPCVVGCEAYNLDEVLQGTYYVLIDGRTGKVWLSSEPFDIDLASTLPIDLLAPLFDLVITEDDWVQVQSYDEAMSVEPFVTKIGVPVDNLTEIDLMHLSQVFAKVVLINPEKKDRVSKFIGTPRLSNMKNARKMDAAVIHNTLHNVVFDSGEWQESAVAKPFKTMADVSNPDFIGYITQEFIENVMGDMDTFEKISKDMGISSRTIVMESILGLLEKRIKIG